MAITVSWYEWNGADDPEVDDGSVITEIVVGSVDDYDFEPADHKIQAGDNSYSKHIKVRWTGVGENTVDNAKLYKSAGDYKTDEVLKYNEDFDKGSTPPGTDDIGGAPIPVALPDAQNLHLPDSGDVLEGDGYSEQFALQAQTSAATEPGALNTKTLTLVYDVY